MRALLAIVLMCVCCVPAMARPCFKVGAKAVCVAKHVRASVPRVAEVVRCAACNKCEGTCDCGCAEGKPCDCGKTEAKACACGCGCAEGKLCTCGSKCKCNCGCKEGKKCDCGKGKAEEAKPAAAAPAPAPAK